MKRAKVQCTELASEVIFRPGIIQVNICIYVYPRRCKIFCSINNEKIDYALSCLVVHPAYCISRINLTCYFSNVKKKKQLIKCSKSFFL